jgi:hypothetical protein
MHEVLLPLDHSSPARHDACLSPQSTEQPPQIPFGDDTGTLQE